MEEIRNDFSNGLFVVDEGFQHLSLTVCWDDVVVGDGSGHEAGVTLWNGYFITGASYS